MTTISRLVQSASSATHLGGVPRRLVLATVGTLAKLCTSVLNRTRVYNMDTLIDLVQSRPPGIPLVTVSNHMSTLDDPLMWGLTGLPIADSKLTRWTLTAEDICFTNPVFSYLFRLGKCLPITRGAGIFQPYMNDALDVINSGDWLHIFPEGKLSQEEGPMRRLKWGAASLIARANVQPIVLPIAHSGFEKVYPENFWFGRRSPLPLAMKHISIVVGEPLIFDIQQLKLFAKSTRPNAAYDAGDASNKDYTESTCFGSNNTTHNERGAACYAGDASNKDNTKSTLFGSNNTTHNERGAPCDASNKDYTQSTFFGSDNTTHSDRGAADDAALCIQLDSRLETRPNSVLGEEPSVILDEDATHATHNERGGADAPSCIQLDSRLETRTKSVLGRGPSVSLDEDATRWMYSHMSETMRCVLQDLASKAKSINKVHR